MIFDRGAENMLPFFSATDIARELEFVYRKYVNRRRIDSSGDYGEYDDTNRQQVYLKSRQVHIRTGNQFPKQIQTNRKFSWRLYISHYI